MVRGRDIHHLWVLPATGAALTALLVFAPAASATPPGGVSIPMGFLGVELPSLHSIIEAIAQGFFGALAGALVPGFLKHGTVATIQYLVALPDPATWPHVNELEGEMTYLGMSLMPVTLTVTTLRYWVAGLTGSAHPAAALARCAAASGVLVIYRWLVEQAVAISNTLTHAALGLPVVANGLASIITVLFGGALLLGAGGVFGAFLVLVGVVFAAALFASKEALTVVLALVFCAGPPFIALSPIPELAHLARVWAHALLAIVLVPFMWTLLFAVAGALTLDATSFTSASGGLPGRVEAAFAGLITFALAVKLPLILFGQLRHILTSGIAAGRTSSGASASSAVPGAARVQAAHARLRLAGTEGLTSIGRSAGRAAGALGAPAGGPAGAARRGAARLATRGGLAPAAALAGAGAGAAGGAAAARSSGRAAGRRGVGARLKDAGQVMRRAPADAVSAVNAAAQATAAATRASGRPDGPRTSSTAGRKPPRPAGARGSAPGGQPSKVNARNTAGAGTSHRTPDANTGRVRSAHTPRGQTRKAAAASTPRKTPATPPPPLVDQSPRTKPNGKGTGAPRKPTDQPASPPPPRRTRRKPRPNGGGV
jgi:hypothetical protein